MLHNTPPDIRPAWGALVLLVLAGYVGSDDGGSAAETDPSASEPVMEARITPPVTQAGESQIKGLAIRQFDPIGEGSLTMGDKTLSFQVADCALGEVELPTEWTRDIYIIGAGKDEGRDFFIHIKRHKQSRRSNTSVTFTYTALPAAYAELVDLNDPSIAEMWQIIRKSDGGMSMMTKPDDLVVEGRSVRSVEPLRMVELTQGTMSARLPEGVLKVDCW